jgi:phosphate transport system substrate-binding protein
VGSSTIGDHVIPEASREFARRRGVGVREGPTGGSGLGIETLLAGEADVAGVARSLTVDEKQLPIEYTIIGYDAIRVFVHPSNPVSSLDEMQLRGIFTGKISRWNEIGGNDAPIVCITQVWGAQRAQMVEFQKQLLRGAGFRTDRREFDRQSDEIRALSDEPNGITVVSAAYATADVRAIMLQGTVQDRHGLKLGGYALSRPLLLLTPAEASTESKDFVRFLLSPAGQAIVAHKFIPLRPLQPVGSS